MIKQGAAPTWLLLACLALGAASCTVVPGVQVPSPVVGVPATVQPQTEKPAASPTVALAPKGTTAPAATLVPPTPARSAQVTAAAASTASSAAVQQPSLRSEIFLAGAPTPRAIANHCPMLENLQSGEKAATFVSTLDSGLLCLFGFGENETVQYAVQDAAGQAVDSGQSTPSNLDGDPVPSVKVMLAIGDWAPGTWYVKASASSGELNTSFTVQPKTMDGKPVLVLSLGNRQLSFAAGQSVNIAAYGLPATGTPQLGVYEVTGNSNQGRNLKLHEAVVLEPDAGAAFVTLTFDPSYQPREYCLVLQASTDYEPAGELSPLGATRCFEVTK